jgi:chaperonin cofactor prefoldin
VTDDELKQTIADLAASVEAHTLSLDRLEDAILADRERSNQLERVALSLTRLYDRERKALRAGLSELATAQANTERNLTLMIEHFDRKVDALATGQERLQQGQAEMQAAIAQMVRAVFKTNERIDSLENGQP